MQLRHLSLEELNIALDRIRESPKHQGRLELIAARPEQGKRVVLDVGELDPFERSSRHRHVEQRARNRQFVERKERKYFRGDAKRAAARVRTLELSDLLGRRGPRP